MLDIRWTQEQIKAVSDPAGATIVVSLIYVAIQIKQNSQNHRSGPQNRTVENGQHRTILINREIPLNRLMRAPSE